MMWFKRFLMMAIIGLFFNSCAIRELALALDKDGEAKAPSWQLDYEIPLISKGIDLAEEFPELMNLLDVYSFTNNTTTDADGVSSNKALIHVKLAEIPLSGPGSAPLTWPFPVEDTKVPTIIEGSIPTVAGIDIDGDDVDDFSLDTIDSTDGDFSIYINLQLQKASGDPFLSGEEENYFIDGKPCFKFNSINIAGKSYQFNDGVFIKNETGSGGRLKLSVKDFLNSKSPNIKVPASGQIDIAFPDPLEIKGKDIEEPLELATFVSTNSYAGAKISFEVEVSMGETFQLGGKFLSEFEVFSFGDNPIELPLDVINNFIKDIYLELDIYSGLPFPVLLKDGKIVSDDKRKELNFMMDDKLADEIALTTGSNDFKISFSDKLSTLDNGSFSLSVLIPKDSKMSLSHNMDFKVSLEAIVGGEALIDLGNLL